MLKAIGLFSMEDLFVDIPQEVRLKGELEIPQGKSELEVKREMEDLAGKNRVFRTIFRGAGAYRHYIPAAVTSIISKENFLTAYTPYQAEVSQGILQSIFEYQTMICDLTGMDASNASVYDGASAAAEGVAMCRERKRAKALISGATSPYVIQTIQTYCHGNGMEMEVIPEKDGKTDWEKLKARLDSGTACVYIQHPNFYGNLEAMFDQIHGKEISYNNLLDINAAVDLIDEFDDLTFAILKHNNACGLASRATVLEAWKDALAGDPVSAFGGVLITNGVIDKEAAEEINKIFFEVIIAPDYDVDALEILGQKKNRIILVRKEAKLPKKQFHALLNGVLVQDKDTNIETVADLKTVTDKTPTPEEVEDMLFANKIVKNSKSNAVVLAKDKQLLASGVGQTSRVDALKQAIEKAKSFGFDLNGAVMASDAFFPFPDCVEIADKEGITAVIQPGGSVKDDLSFAYCNEHGMAMVTTGIRHFKH